MRIKWGQDMAAGVLFVLVGIGALLTIYYYDNLSMGTAQRPGTGVLPAILSWCLIGTGLILAIKSISFSDEAVPKVAWRPFILVTLGVVAFGLLIDQWGLVLTMLIAMTLCAAGTRETRWGEFAIFTVIMMAIGVGMFIWMLGMPINVWPTKAVPSFLAGILR